MQKFATRYSFSISGYSASEQFLAIYRKKSHIFSFWLRRIKSRHAEFDDQFVIDCYTPELINLVQNDVKFRAQINSIFSDPNLVSIKFLKSFFVTNWKNHKIDVTSEKDTLNKLQQFAAEHLSIKPSCEPSWRRNAWLCSVLAVFPLFISFLFTIIALKPPQSYLMPVILTYNDLPYHIFYTVAVVMCFAVFVALNIKIPEDFGIRRILTLTSLFALSFFISTSFFLPTKLLSSNWDFLLGREIAKIPAVITNFDWHLKCPNGEEIPSCASIRVPYALLSFDESVKAKYSNILKFEGLQILTYLPVQQPGNPDNYLVAGIQPAVTLVVTKGLLGRTYIKEVIFDEEPVRLNSQGSKH